MEGLAGSLEDSFAFQNIVYDIGRTDAGAIGIEWFAGLTAAKPELQVGEPEISGTPGCF